MAFNKDKEITYKVYDGFDFVLDEGSNSSTNLRKVAWGDGQPKLEVRKWTYSDGKERAGKGCTLTDKAADELATVLVENGYGDTKRIANAISNREDIDDTDEEEYYDPNELLGE